MSRTPVNFGVVVGELLKGLVPVDSEEALRCDLTPGQLLSNFRTIRFGTGGSTDVIAYSYSLITPWQRSLVLLPRLAEIAVWNLGYSVNIPEINELPPIVLSDYPDHIRGHKFSNVIIVNAREYFNKYNYEQVFNYLTECTTKDVVIYLIN